LRKQIIHRDRSPMSADHDVGTAHPSSRRRHGAAEPEAGG
jgi:hypothetical protein